MNPKIYGECPMCGEHRVLIDFQWKIIGEPGDELSCLECCDDMEFNMIMQNEYPEESKKEANRILRSLHEAGLLLECKEEE